MPKEKVEAVEAESPTEGVSDVVEPSKAFDAVADEIERGHPAHPDTFAAPVAADPDMARNPQETPEEYAKALASKKE